MRSADAVNVLVATLVLATTPFGPGALVAQEHRLADARVTLSDGVLTLANSRIERRFRWNEGNLVSIEIADPVTDRSWDLAGSVPDLEPLGATLESEGGWFAARTIEETPISPAHIEVDARFVAGDLEVRRTCVVTPGVPAIGCTVGMKRRPRDQPPTTDPAITGANETAAVPDPITERLVLPAGQWSLEAGSFRVATDHNDWLVDLHPGELYRRDRHIAANVLRLEERIDGGQVFLIKEGPIGDDQIAYPGYDFALRTGDVRVVGSGVTARDLEGDGWHDAYSVAVGVADSGERAALVAMREYVETLRTYRPQRDAMIVLNTWGDRSRDSRMSEAFALRELEAANRFGFTHLQLDDGWQAGLSKNSSVEAGRLWTDWSADSWKPHPERFPRGFGPVIERARELGLEIGLWFNPSSTDDYSSWQRDADILIDLHRSYGVRVFKIDGIDLPSRTAESNLGRLFAAVTEATNGDVVFNIDVTAGRRQGYFHHLNSYGNIFVENRYTDWGNYYPYRTLRNLWMLSRYVPPQFLQMEFLNIWRNADKYPPGDPFAPSRVSLAYAFAVTMAAQPLAWFEASNLPPDAASIAPLVKKYRSIADEFHAGKVLPIGERPDGTSWTGFQSIGTDDRSGYLLVFREANDRLQSSIATWLPEGRRVHLSPVLGDGTALVTPIAAGGRIELRLAVPNSFVLYRYIVE
jgi:hypothetical protein